MHYHKAIGGIKMENLKNGYASESIKKNVAEAIEEILPTKLRSFRKKSGLTTNDVGEMLKKTPSTVTMWETGKSLPDVETLFNLCNIYKIADINDFFDTGVSPDIKSLARSEQELIMLWRKSPTTVRAAIKTLLKECNK